MSDDRLPRDDGKVWYLPHHPVFHSKKPDKVRILFDCSAKHHGTSLNDNILLGPDLTNNLVGVLTRFRQEPFAVMGDIEAMFHQVHTLDDDCDALRFLWWSDGNLASEPEEYQMNVHIFGAISSPSCANFALLRTAEDNQQDFEEPIISSVKNNFYVDDCLKSLPTVDDAIRPRQGTSRITSTWRLQINKMNRKLQGDSQVYPAERVCKESNRT